MPENREVRLITKRTFTPNKVPSGTTGSELAAIKAGEIASNLADRKLYGYDNSEVFEYGSNSFLGLTGGTVSGDTLFQGDVYSDNISAMTRNNFVLVKEASDLGQSVGGKITLEGDTLYEINGLINLGTSSVNITGDTTIRGGSGFLDGFVYLGTGHTFESTDVNVTFSNLFLLNYFGGAFNLKDTTRTKILFSQDMILSGGSAHNYCEGFYLQYFEKNLLQSCQCGFNFLEPLNLKLTSVGYDVTNTGDFMYLSSSTFVNQIDVVNNQFYTSGSADTAVHIDMDNVASLGGGNFLGNYLFGNGNPIEGFDTSYNEWIFNSNAGIPNTNERSNYVLVRNLRNLPDPVGGEIFLESDTVYDFEGLVNIGSNTLVMDNNSSIRGSLRTSDGIFYTGTGNTIYSLNSNFNISNLTVYSPNGTSVYAESTPVFSIGTNNFIISEAVFFGNKLSINSKNPGIMSISRCLFSGGEDDIFLEGDSSNSFYMVDNVFLSTSGTSLNFSDSVWNYINVNRNSFNINSGYTTISAATNSGNIQEGSKGVINGNTFCGDGEYLDGVKDNGNSWFILGNVGVSDDADFLSSGEVFVTGNTTTTVISSVSTPVIVDSNNFNSDFLDRFSADTSGGLVYLGLDDKIAKLDATVYFESTNNQQITFYFAVDSGAGYDIITKTKGLAKTSGANETTFCNPKGLYTISHGDKIAVFVENNTSTSNILISDMNMTIY